MSVLDTEDLPAALPWAALLRAGPAGADVPVAGALLAAVAVLRLLVLPVLTAVLLRGVGDGPVLPNAPTEDSPGLDPPEVGALAAAVAPLTGEPGELAVGTWR